MKFYKYHGLGNDFILIEDFNKKIRKNKKIIRYLCNRNFGIGADGIIYIQKSKNYSMQLFNSDGSKAKMCGNGIRCLAKHLYDFGYVKKNKFDIKTDCGIKTLEVKIKNGKVKTVKVNMGAPKFLGTKTLFNEKLYLVSMGNPHAVLFKNKINIQEVKEKGQRIEAHPFFPNRTNVEFVHIKNNKEVELVVYERGAGLTHACGTGACAAIAAASKKNLIELEKPINVFLPGGKLKIKIKKDYSAIFMQGPAELVFIGEIKKAP